jgi:hypothetical protein
MAILGTILVLSGAASLWAAALTRPRTAENPDATGSGTAPSGTVTTGPTRTERTIDTVSRVPTPDRLIMWGVVLLAVAAVAAGAIQISASATAGNQ